MAVHLTHSAPEGLVASDEPTRPQRRLRVPGARNGHISIPSVLVWLLVTGVSLALGVRAGSLTPSVLLSSATAGLCAVGALHHPQRRAAWGAQ